MYLRCILKPGPFRLTLSLTIGLAKKSGCNFKSREHTVRCATVDTVNFIWKPRQVVPPCVTSKVPGFLIKHWKMLFWRYGNLTDIETSDKPSVYYTYINLPHTNRNL